MPADTLSLEGKVAIVTGSGRENGIGAGIAIALARNGAAVTINYVSSSVTERANNLASAIRANGGRAAVVQTTVDSPEGARYLVDETLKAFSTNHIDILINNAGAGFVGETLQAKPEEIDKMFNVNVKGPVYVAQAVIPHMPAGGRVINVSSTASKMGLNELPIYGASKAALDSLTWSWAKEVCEVSTPLRPTAKSHSGGGAEASLSMRVAPGPVATDIVPPDMVEELTGPQKEITRAAERLGTTEDLGDAVLLLVSERSRWITGQYISVSGGITGV